MPNNYQIDILLSAYNGEKYLKEQIQSIVNQTYTDWRLLIRDDGSTDSTLAIIADFCKQFPQKIVLLSDNLGNLGVTRSFEQLLLASDASYTMFCDQDDYWRPEKVALTLQKMHEMEQTYGQIPLLVHTDMCVVNQDRELIDTSIRHYSKVNPELIESDIHYLAICNCIAGCSMMINRKAREISLPFGNIIEMHDVWVAIHTMKFGKVGYLPQATIEYRQHGNNVSGAQASTFSVWNKLHNLSKIWHFAKQRYYFYHPFVFKWFGEFIYFKIKYFVKVRTQKKV